MLSGIDLNQTIDFVSQFDKNEPKTVFKIGAVSSAVQARIGKLIGPDGSGSLDAMLEAFKAGVRGIINLTDKNGVPIAYTPAVADILPIKVISEVGAKIISLSQLSEEEEKN